jgi:hypothetical protein
MLQLLASNLILAWRPFLEPLDLHDHWPWLMFPLVLVVSVVYRTLRTTDLDKLPGETLGLMAYILFWMVVAAGGLWILVEVV